MPIVGANGRRMHTMQGTDKVTTGLLTTMSCQTTEMEIEPEGRKVKSAQRALVVIDSFGSRSPSSGWGICWWRFGGGGGPDCYIICRSVGTESVENCMRFMFAPIHECLSLNFLLFEHLVHAYHVT